MYCACDEVKKDNIWGLGLFAGTGGGNVCRGFCGETGGKEATWIDGTIVPTLIFKE